MTAGAGFMLAVLWFDLMFDIQILRADRAGAPSHRAATAIAAYYGRVTTGARPMNELVRVVMLGTLVAIIVQAVREPDNTWVAWCSLALTGSAVVLATARTVGNAVRLGRATDPPSEQVRLSRSIARDHIYCFSVIAAVLALQLGFARG